MQFDADDDGQPFFGPPSIISAVPASDRRPGVAGDTAAQATATIEQED